MKILITGAKGQLGLELAKQLSSNNKYELISTNRERLLNLAKPLIKIEYGKYLNKIAKVE